MAATTSDQATTANDTFVYGAFIALPLGSLGFAILAARELDQAFANVYSTAVLDPEPAPAVGPSDPGRRHRRADHGGRALA